MTARFILSVPSTPPSSGVTAYVRGLSVEERFALRLALAGKQLDSDLEAHAVDLTGKTDDQILAHFKAARGE